MEAASLAHLSEARGRIPKQPKKSAKKPFSRMPTNPVAGDALNRHLFKVIEPCVMATLPLPGAGATSTPAIRFAAPAAASPEKADE